MSAAPTRIAESPAFDDGRVGDVIGYDIYPGIGRREYVQPEYVGMHLDFARSSALAHGRRAAELAKERGSPFSRVESAAFLGAAELAAGDVAIATSTLEMTRSLRARNSPSVPVTGPPP